MELAGQAPPIGRGVEDEPDEVPAGGSAADDRQLEPPRPRDIGFLEWPAWPPCAHPSLVMGSGNGLSRRRAVKQAFSPLSPHISSVFFQFSMARRPFCWYRGICDVSRPNKKGHSQ